jgi:hypothetical protein
MTLDAAGVERYLPTIYRSFQLPSNFLTVPHETLFEEAAKQRLRSFVDQHIGVLRRRFHPRVVGFIFCYKTPAVDLAGAGRIFVLSSQQIGSFISATPSENQLLEGFHRDILDKYRRRRRD